VSSPQGYSVIAFDASGQRLNAPMYEDTRLRDDHEAPRISRTGWYLWQTDRPFPSDVFLTRGYILCKEPPCCDIPLEVRPTDFAQHVKLHDGLTMRQYLRRHPSQLDLMPEHRIAAS
jgi:hypothetical protein